MQSAKTACAAALENAEGVREALKGKNVLEAAQKSSTAAYRAHSVRRNLTIWYIQFGSKVMPRPCSISSVGAA